VRVFLSLDGSASQVTSVSGALFASPPGTLGNLNTGFPLAPHRLESRNSTTVAHKTINELRGQLSGSLNFELPPEWLVGGDIHLEFRPEIEGQDSVLDCIGCDNLNAFNVPKLSPLPPSLPYNCGS
jgi:hypothetical protein